MKRSAVQVDNLDCRSKCVTRNGTYPISEVTLDETGDGMVSLAFVSKRLSRHLNAGATISVGDMDRLAALWMQSRGAKKSDRGDRIRRLVGEIRRAADALNKEIP